MSAYIACPWCSEPDFDEVGLRGHVLFWGCDAFDAAASDETWAERRAALASPTSTEERKG